MIVCHCHGITDRELLTAGREHKPDATPCVAGTACGGCRPLVEELLQRTEARPQATTAVPRRSDDA